MHVALGYSITFYLKNAKYGPYSYRRWQRKLFGIAQIKKFYLKIMNI